MLSYCRSCIKFDSVGFFDVTGKLITAVSSMHKKHTRGSHVLTGTNYFCSSYHGMGRKIFIFVVMAIQVSCLRSPSSMFYFWCITLLSCISCLLVDRDNVPSSLLLLAVCLAIFSVIFVKLCTFCSCTSRWKGPCKVLVRFSFTGYIYYWKRLCFSTCRTFLVKKLKGIINQRLN